MDKLLASLKGLVAALQELASALYAHPETDPKDLPMNQPPVSQPPPNNVLNAMCLAIQHHEGGRSTDLNMRLNNPGACRFFPSGYLGIYGTVTEYKTGGEKPGQHGFAHFPTYQLGFLYLKNLIKTKALKHPTWNLYTFFGDTKEGWAPSSDNNDPRRYAEAVAEDMQVNPATFQLHQLLTVGSATRQFWERRQEKPGQGVL